MNMCHKERVYSSRELETRDDLSSKPMSGNSELRTVDSEITKLSRKVRKHHPFPTQADAAHVSGLLQDAWAKGDVVASALVPRPRNAEAARP